MARNLLWYCHELFLYSFFVWLLEVGASISTSSCTENIHSNALSQFLEMVKKKFEELKNEMPKIEIKGTGVQQLREIDRFLVAHGFELYEEVWGDETQEV